MAEQMKESGIQWIGAIPYNWNVERIKHIIQNNDNGIKVGPFGSALTNEVVSSDEGKYKVYGQSNLIRKDFSYGDNYVSEQNYKRLINYEVLPNDIAVSMMGTIGKCSVVPDNIEPGIMDSHLIKIRLSQKMLPRYFEYAYESDMGYNQLLINSKGSIMNGLNSTIVKGLYIPVPGIVEQQAIVDFLDKESAQIDSIAADLEKQVTLLQQYKKSLITETVTKGLDKSVPMKDSGVEFFGKIPAHWKVSKTKYVADISIGLVTTMTANYVDEDGVPLIRNSNIRTNHIDDNGMVYLSKEFAKANIGRALHKGDIVTVHTGDVGTSAIINETYHMSHGFATIISRLKTKTVNNQFLCWLYNSEIFKEMSIAYSTGDGRQNLNLYDFVDFYILIPTLKEQMEIVNWLNLKCTEIDNFIENKQQQLLLIQQHKKSLIYEYVTGKKRVKEVR